MERRQNKATDKKAGQGRKRRSGEKTIDPDIYPVIDTDLARDNLENDITEADLADL